MSMRPDLPGSVPGLYRGAPGATAGDASSVGRRFAAGWTPTTPALLGLVLLEVGAYIALRWVFRTAHGG